MILKKNESLGTPQRVPFHQPYQHLSKAYRIKIYRMDKPLEGKIKNLVSNFHLLRTKEGSEQFDKMWKELQETIPVEERREAGKILRREMSDRRKSIKRVDVNVRSQLGDLSNAISLSYIAKQYFQRDRSWLAQRVNGNIVNGKPCAFTDDELKVLKSALNDIKNKLSETILNIK
jgi:hypothetical protein